MDNNTIDNLTKWALQYEAPAFVDTDPVQFPRRYTKKQDVEISAFVTAWLSWGNRNQIIKHADYIDREIFKGQPYEYIMQDMYMNFRCEHTCLYRTYTWNDFYLLCLTLNDIYSWFNSLEDCYNHYSQDDFLELFKRVKGIPNPGSGSAMKRFNMFLRWMVRKGSPVDLGVWDCVPASALIVPVDTHVLRIAQVLGLTTRRSADKATAEEITRAMNEVFPGDPCRGDFALFGYGVEHPSKDIKAMSIGDVLALPEYRKHLRNSMISATYLQDARIIEDFKSRGIWEVDTLAGLVADVLDKRAKSFTHTERNFIKLVGMEAFRRTMTQLMKEYESKGV